MDYMQIQEGSETQMVEAVNIQEVNDTQSEESVNGPVGCESKQEYAKAEYCREVEEGFKPFVRQQFFGIEEAVTFYKIYALACGFDVRKYTTKRWSNGGIKSKLLVCNREGFKYVAKGHTAKTKEPGSRENVLTRVGCKARIRLFIKDGVMLIDQFHEGHNHELVSVRDREFQKLSRNITHLHKYMILQNSRLGIGASRTYNMCKEHVNGFANISASLTDFKNFHRDVKCYIHEKDGQMFIDRFKIMVENREGFYFDYDLNPDNSLRRVIWVDRTAKNNYAVFGDSVSYDPTYTTNMYDMIFTPFTGVNNHKRSVTFGGALIANEDHVSFEWVFKRFLMAMGGKEPNYVITDQDPGIIKAFPIFKKARHRFCMWHIMNKVPGKFGVTREDYQEFLKKLNAIIWDEDIEAEEFDTRWAGIMEEHGFSNDEWFVDMFDKRRQWVMAHCRDLDMGGVMRTTQRSESANSFFKKFEGKSGTLLEFWMRFESAMDQQRHAQKKLDNDNRHSSPETITHLEIEQHEAKVYTHEVFKEFKEKAIKSFDTCRTGGYTERDGLEVTVVKDACRGRSYTVEYNPGTSEAKCSCTMFERRGILCRHVVWIYSSNGKKAIPEVFIAKRWSKNALRFNMSHCHGISADDVDVIDGKEIELSKLWSEVHSTVGVLRGMGVAEVESLSTLIREFKEKLLPVIQPMNKQQEMEQFLGCRASEEVTILPPKKCKNKGSGKRLVSGKSKAIALAKKPKRLCNNCKVMAHHDKRNCPNPFSKHPPLSPLSTEQDPEEEEEEEENLQNQWEALLQ